MTIEAWEHRAVIAGYEKAAQFWEDRKEPGLARHWRLLADERRREIQPVKIERAKK